MRRVIVLFALLALAHAIAMSQTISITNDTGTIAVSGMAGTGGLGTIGVTTLTSEGSELVSFDGFDEVGKTALGSLNFTTGTLASGSVSGGGTFNGGGSFTVVGIGKWLEALGAGEGKVTLFTGTWVGPADWTLASHVGAVYTYTLTGNVSGTLWDGTSVTGTTTQNFYTHNGQLLAGIAHITTGDTTLTIP